MRADRIMTERTFHHNSVTARLILGDCRDVLPDIACDHTITDPPYAARTHKGAMTNKLENAPAGYPQGGAKLVHFGCLTDIEFEEAAKLMLKCSRRWVVMTCDHRHAALTFDWPEHIRLGAWVKGAPMPQITGDRPGSGHESVLIMHNPGKKRWNGGGRPAIWHAVVLKDPAVVIQETQKPAKLISQFIADFTDPGETILDPYCGSGTTGVCCLNMGRNFIGVELDEEHFNGACARLERECQQPMLI